MYDKYIFRSRLVDISINLFLNLNIPFAQNR